MICPDCGSRDVIDRRVPERSVIEAECLNCGHDWAQTYEPNIPQGIGLEGLESKEM